MNSHSSFGLLLCSLILVLLSSCKKDESQILLNEHHKKVMVVHDEVMPKMKDIYRLKKQLKGMEESPEVTKMINDLTSADDAMMDWMAQYRKPKASDPEAHSYLDKQEELISKVRDQMLTSIATAKDYVE